MASPPFAPFWHQNGAHLCHLWISELHHTIRLGNDDVTEKVAQTTSCLHPKQFDVALRTVRKALAPELQKKSKSNISYRELINEYELDKNLLRWMQMTDKAIRDSGQLGGDPDFQPDDTAITCSVFYWTCLASHVRILVHTCLAVDQISTRIDSPSEERDAVGSAWRTIRRLQAYHTSIKHHMHRYPGPDTRRRSSQKDWTVFVAATLIIPDKIAIQITIQIALQALGERSSPGHSRFALQTAAVP